jgi:hypothetical protein
MAARELNITGMITPVRRSVAGITPEFYFAKAIDNSRLVLAVDPRSRREIRILFSSACALFLVLMFYTWQHFGALEYGYKIEAQKSEYERLVETNRALKLEEAQLRDPGRIELMAKEMGLDSPSPGQVVRLESDVPGVQVVAQATPITVIPAAQ